MEKNLHLANNKILLLENSVVQYGIYIAETIEKIVNTIEKMHSRTTLNVVIWYLLEQGAAHYAINSFLYIDALQEKIHQII